MEYKDQKEHRIDVLNTVNDAEVFVVITEESIALGGAHDKVVEILSSAIICNEDLRGVVSEAIANVINYKNETRAS